ncbi:TetR/AcrR family transcriptional regulator [Streptomyces sp. NPDC091292]|uniref:TetR/AcrR family transcriptional regulator n=1 Tax=Streptomyces sp. NPDC091292 TaxID=3365991 RepID=UPI0038119931
MANQEHSDRSERSTELLWGTGAARHGLTLERIVRSAVELADAEGLRAVSMRRLAERVGFTTMALYRHVPGKAELLALMRDAVVGELAPPVASDAVGLAAGWRADLEAWARAGIALHRRHPWLAELGDDRHVPGPNVMADFERALSIVARTGLPPAQVVAAVTLVGDFVEGAARQSAATARTERRTGVGHDEWWARRDSLFTQLDHRYPTLVGLYEEGAYDAPLDPFEFGLQRVLDGVAAIAPDGGGRTPEEDGRAPDRDETRDVNEGCDVKACEVCGKPVDRNSAGRPRTYCSRACRQRAYRLRGAADHQDDQGNRGNLR